MALPASRNTTYAAGSQVKSADLNDVQDKIIDLAAGTYETIVNHRLRITSILSAALAAGGVTYDPGTPGPTSSVWRLTMGGANRSFLGIGVNNIFAWRVIHLINADTANTLTLNHEDAGATAAHRFDLASATNLVIPVRGSVILMYDNTSSRWRVMGKSF